MAESDTTAERRRMEQEEIYRMTLPAALFFVVFMLVVFLLGVHRYGYYDLGTILGL